MFGHVVEIDDKKYGGISRSEVSTNLRKPGSDFIVSLGIFQLLEPEMTVAGTFMHELGHNLGLGHGGVVYARDSADNIIYDNGETLLKRSDVNNKPNHISVMNYLFQNKGIRKLDENKEDYEDGHLDYFRLSPLQVSDLFEVVGDPLGSEGLNEQYGLQIFGPVNVDLNEYGSIFYTIEENYLGKMVRAAHAINGLANPIDWNNDDDKDDTMLSQDINIGKHGSNEDEKLYASLNEWENLVFSGGAIGSFGAVVELEDITSADQIDEMPLDVIYEIDSRPSEPMAILVDIKPESENNVIHMGAKGYLPVVIVSTENISAIDIDPSTLKLAGAFASVKGKSGKVGSLEDVNDDGVPDLIIHFAIKELDVSESDTSLVLRGRTKNGFSISGVGSVTFVQHE